MCNFAPKVGINFRFRQPPLRFYIYSKPKDPLSTFQKTVTKEQALQKLKHYCGYQERCHAEVKQKLYSLGLWKKDVETILSQLIEENYLNEERFAKLFAGGKFRMKQWGRVKIKHELKQKQISEYCIKVGLKEISEDDYQKTIRKLAETKWKSLKSEKNIFVKKTKATNYLLQKGFEPGLINTTINSLSAPDQG